MNQSLKCQKCNNVTKNPSGLCWIHEGSSSVDSQFSDILLQNPQLLSSTASEDVTEDMYELGRLYNQELPEPGPERRAINRERIEKGERVAESLGYPPGFRVTHQGDTPFCMRPITDHGRGIAYTFNVQGIDGDLAHDPIEQFTDSGRYRVWLTEMTIPKADERGVGKIFDKNAPREFLQEWEITGVVERAGAEHSDLQHREGYNDYHMEVGAGDLRTTLEALTDYVSKR